MTPRDGDTTPPGSRETARRCAGFGGAGDGIRRPRRDRAGDRPDDDATGDGHSAGPGRRGGGGGAQRLGRLGRARRGGPVRGGPCRNGPALRRPDPAQHRVAEVQPRRCSQRLHPDQHAGRSPHGTTNTAAVGEALARGWTSFFVRLVAVAGLAGGVLYLVGIAVGAMVGRPTRPGARAAPGLAAAPQRAPVHGRHGASAALTVVTARDQLARVSTLADLMGTAPLVPIPAPSAQRAATSRSRSSATRPRPGSATRRFPSRPTLDKTCGRSRGRVRHGACSPPPVCRSTTWRAARRRSRRACSVPRPGGRRENPAPGRGAQVDDVAASRDRQRRSQRRRLVGLPEVLLRAAALRRPAQRAA